jgi:hypothetical protein
MPRQQFSTTKSEIYYIYVCTPKILREKTHATRFHDRLKEGGGAVTQPNTGWATRALGQEIGPM